VETLLAPANTGDHDLVGTRVIRIDLTWGQSTHLPR